MGATIDLDPITRNGYGQPVIDGITYIRASSMKDAIEDQHGLRVWDQRMVAFGLADRSDLYDKLQDIDRSDKTTVNRLCKAAAKAGGSEIRSELGTAIHKVFELSWFDDEYTPPEQFVKLVGVVREQLRRCGLTVVPDSIERFVINEEHQVAGTFDLCVTDGTDIFVADIKTGSSVGFGGVGFACQLACYANADWFYDGHARTPMWEVSKSTGVIIHANPDDSTCDLYWLDLEVGAQALELAIEVREIRKAKPMVKVQPTAVVKAETLAVLHSDWREWITARVRALLDAGHGQLVADLWPDDVPRLGKNEPYDEDQQATIIQLVSNVERITGAMFPPPAPDLSVQTAVQEPVQVKPDRRPTPDDVGTVDAEQIDAVKTAIDELEAEQQQWLTTIIKACSEANYPINLTTRGGKPSARRHAIVLALLAFAPHQDDDTLAAAIWLARNEPRHPDMSIGELVGSMTLTEAHQTISTADDLRTGAMHLVFDTHGADIVTTKTPKTPKDGQS
jgi:hypothetical protein